MIDAPADLPLHWSARGGFDVTDHSDGGVRQIEATIRGTSAESPERGMVAAADFQPLFLLTSRSRLEEMGAIYWRQSHDKASVTPQISALAAKLARGRAGEAAARAIYDYVAASIRDVALYLDPSDGWVPHDANSVLRAGYGDSKDHLVLMQALLAALGIRAEAALVDWGNRTTEAPLWMPQYNHALLYLPDFDRYLNPANAYATYDTVDRRLSGKTTVLATPAGEIGHTPPSKSGDQVYRDEARIMVEPDGTVTGVAKLSMSGNLESMMRALVAQSASTRDLAERLLSATPEGGFGTFSTTNPHDLDEAFSMVGTWRSPRAVAPGLKAMFMTVPVGLDVNPASRVRELLSEEGTRQHAMIAAASDSEWRTTVKLPERMIVTRLPGDVRLANNAGTYTADYGRSGGDVVVTRHLTINRNTYTAASYPDLEKLLYASLGDALAVLQVSPDGDQAAAATQLRSSRESKPASCHWLQP